MADIKGVWIITGTGLCVLHRTYSTDGSNIDQTLFAGFLSAIMSMAQEVTNSEIQKIDMKQLILHFQYFPENDYYIVVSALNKVNHNKINEFVKELQFYFDTNIYPIIKSFYVPKLDDIESFYPEIDNITKKHFKIPTTQESQEFPETNYQNMLTIQKIREILERVEKQELKPEEAAPKVVELYQQLNEDDKLRFSKTIEQLEQFIKKTELIEKKQRKQLLKISGKVKTHMKVEQWLTSF